MFPDLIRPTICAAIATVTMTAQLSFSNVINVSWSTLPVLALAASALIT
jgi:hypothetical protein